MSLEQFKPLLMRRAIMRALDKQTVFRRFTWMPDNVEDPKTIGQSVTLPSIGSLATASYTGGTITYQSVDDQSQTLLINSQILCPVAVADIDRIQCVAGTYPAIAEEMGVSMANSIDEALATGIYGQAGVSEDLSSDGIDSNNVFDALMTLRAKMKINNVSQMLPLFVDPYLAKTITQAGILTKLNNDAEYSTGVLGTSAGFMIVETNSLTKTGTYADGDLVVNACAFTPNRSVAFVAQKDFSIEMMRSQTKMEDLMRAHMIYGWKVVRADEVAHFKVKVNKETSI